MTKIRQVWTACTASLLVLGLAPVLHAAQPQKTSSTGAAVPAQPRGAVLYSQLDFPSTGGATSQNFEVANDAFDTEDADDFVVPAGGWSINEVAVTGTYSAGGGPAPTVHVAFYANAGALPGAAIPACDYPAVVPVGGPSFVVPLAPPCDLTPGTYWVSVVANMNFTPLGQWFWSNRTVVANSPAVWRNPGGGFAIPACLAFGARVATCNVAPPDADQGFALSGAVLPVELLSFEVE